jgi:hypothetical protein
VAQAGDIVLARSITSVTAGAEACGRNRETTYLNPEDQSITASRDMPAADQGSTPGLAEVRKRIEMFS